ncbi:MAG TPA: 3-methylornithyl-N6-L-lysine dehydrogenase PylD [Methanomassiliicoccales archaeon]|jgi:pyrrolysine biosynthesis protein PylD
MTRLTYEMIENVPDSMGLRDERLRHDLGMDMKCLAYLALGLEESDLNLNGFKAAAVPVTSGKGVTPGFCDSVCAITRHLGMESHVTEGTDVAGFYQAMEAGADIVFMADDQEFVAINMREHRAADNTHSTALGYFSALKRAVGPLAGKEVLVIGAGRVGSCAIDLLADEKASITVMDSDLSKIESVKRRYPDVRTVNDLERAVSGAGAIINASPARIPGEWIREGAIISSPGMPYSFDDLGESKARVLVHDPLQIGVSVMAVWSASYSMQRKPKGIAWAQAIEVIQ